MTNLDPNIWGPHYWFFLHTISMTYPVRPNSVTKKKYYELIMNMPTFIPIEKMSGEFSKLLDLYPITPYLDTRESFIRWIWFIHNKINSKLDKPQITLNDFYVKYYEAYKPKNLKLVEQYKIREKVIYTLLVSSLIGTIYYLYDK
jgi:hypothetical protein